MSLIFFLSAGQNSGLKSGGPGSRLGVGNWTGNNDETGIICWAGIVGLGVWDLRGHDGEGVEGREEKYEPLLYAWTPVRVTPVGGHSHVHKSRKFEPKHAAFETKTGKVGRVIQGLSPFNPLISQLGAKNSLKRVAGMLNEATLAGSVTEGGATVTLVIQSL